MPADDAPAVTTVIRDLSIRMVALEASRFRLESKITQMEHTNVVLEARLQEAERTLESIRELGLII